MWRARSRAPRVTLATVAIGHHAGPSGYHALVPHAMASMPRVEAIAPRPLPRRLRDEHAVRLVERARPRWYSRDTLSLEIAAAQRMLTRRTDVVHLLYGDEMLWYTGSVARLSGRRGPRLVATFHQPPEVLADVGPGPRRLRDVHGAIALAGEQAGFLRELIGEERVFEARHGVATDWWRPAEAARDDATCLFVGQWLRDVEVLRGVAALLAERAPDVRIRTAGASPEAVRALDGAANVTVLPRIGDADLRAEYRRASLLLLPLRDATANCAMLEAMACGTPIVVTNVGGTRDYVDDASAALTEHGSAEAMATAVLDLLGDAPRRAALGAAARQRSLELDFRHSVARHAEIYGLVSGRA